MFTIHFGGFSPYFWVDTHIVESPIIESLCIDMMSPQDLDDVIKAAPGAVERVPWYLTVVIGTVEHWYLVNGPFL